MALSRTSIGSEPTLPAIRSLALERSLLRGLAVLRWVSIIWVIGVVLYSARGSKDYIAHPLVVMAALALGLVVTIVTTRFATQDTARALRLPTVLADVGTAVALYLADGYGFAEKHVFNPGQALTASWPICAVASTGIAFGPLAGFLAGFLMGFSRFLSALLNGFDDWGANAFGSLANTTVFSAVWGFIAGWVSMQMRRAENEVANARAREDFARTMHDSVLQTLSLVERRSRATDPQLADSARRTDRELRAYLFGGADSTTETLVLGLRRVVDRAILDHGLPVELSMVDGDEPPEDVAAAIVAAAGEALTNAAKHANATKVVVFCDPDDGPVGGQVFVSVKDNGKGFDRATIDPSRRGLLGSIEQRMTDVEGRSEIVSGVGKGTEVRLWGP
jgi:signal transduction histidine kinase